MAASTARALSAPSTRSRSPTSSRRRSQSGTTSSMRPICRPPPTAKPTSGEHDPEKWEPVSRLREARFGGRRKVGKDHAQANKSASGRRVRLARRGQRAFDRIVEDRGDIVGQLFIDGAGTTLADIDPTVEVRQFRQRGVFPNEHAGFFLPPAGDRYNAETGVDRAAKTDRARTGENVFPVEAGRLQCLHREPVINAKLAIETTGTHRL